MENPKEVDPLKIALGVMAGIVGAYLLIVSVERWRWQQVLHDITQQTAVWLKDTQLDRHQRAEEDRQARAWAMAQEQARLAEQERLRAENARQQAERSRQLQAAAEAKEQAWKRFYTRPSYCDKAVGEAWVECGNQYIRAKREFERVYATGQLQP